MVDTITNEATNEAAVETANKSVETNTLFDIADGENQQSIPFSGSEQKELANAAREDSQALAEWYYDEKIRGNGTPPEWFNHKTFKNVTEQARAYNESQKKLTEYSERIKGFSGAPEQYEENDNAKDNVFAAGLKDTGKKIGLNQEGFNELFAVYNKTREIEAEKEQVNQLQKQKEELKKIGGITKLKELETKFLDNFGANTAAWLKSSIRSYDDYVNLEGIASKLTNRTRIPTSSAETIISTRDQAEELIRDPRWGKDRDFTQRADKLIGQMLQSGHS
ncbi:hypothetical protein GAMM_130004 [Gammaproteobacteria bacterium]